MSLWSSGRAVGCNPTGEGSIPSRDSKERRKYFVKKKNVDKHLVDSVMDFILDHEPTVETLDVIQEKVGKEINKINLKMNKKMMKELKEGETVYFLDKKGFEQKGIITNKDNKVAEVLVVVEGIKKIWRVSPKFLYKKERKKRKKK